MYIDSESISLASIAKCMVDDLGQCNVDMICNDNGVMALDTAWSASNDDS
jgi:hypothetical protein